MYDGGTVDDRSDQYAYPQYRENVLAQLEADEGVACFEARSSEGSESIVLYCSHRITGPAWETAHSDSEYVRAVQAILLQRNGAREYARSNGYEAIFE